MGSRGGLVVCNVAELKKDAPAALAENSHGSVTISNTENKEYTCISIQANDRPGLLSAVTAAFRDLGLLVRKVYRVHALSMSMLS